MTGFAGSAQSWLVAVLILIFPRLLKGANDNFETKLVCTPQHMVVYVKYLVDEEFSGVVYTEGSFEQPDCYREVDGSSQFTFKIPYDGCKTVNENGIYRNVLIVQHQKRIMTGEDGAFKISCDRKNIEKSAKITVTDSMYMTDDKKDSPEVLFPQKFGTKSKKEKLVFDGKNTLTYVKPTNGTSTGGNYVKGYLHKY